MSAKIKCRNNHVAAGSKGEFGLYEEKIAKRLSQKGLVSIIEPQAPTPEPKEFTALNSKPEGKK